MTRKRTHYLGLLITEEMLAALREIGERDGGGSMAPHARRLLALGILYDTRAAASRKARAAAAAEVPEEERDALDKAR